MRISLAVSLSATLVVLASADSYLLAAVVPPTGLSPGSQYQLIFVTAASSAAESSDIGVYNTFVTSEALTGVPSGLPAAATWTVVGSTEDVDANVNAPSGTLPVYNTAGELVAAGGVGIYTGTLENLVAYDQHGDLNPAAQDNMWTGSDFEGFGIPGATLGDASGDSEVGQLALDATWLEFDVLPQFTEFVITRPMYALSGPITYVPEPSTAALAVIAVMALAAACGRRRRR